MQHQKNLLEAFQDANDERRGGESVSAGPFAGDLFSEQKVSRSKSVLPELSARDSRTIVTVAGVGILCLVVGLVVGRMLYAPENDALAGFDDASGEFEPLSAGTAGDEAAAAEVDAVWNLGSGVAMNEALNDPANRYSVIAVAYGNTEEQLALAYETFYHFEDLGFPVAQPLSSGGQILVLVGAAPTRAALASVQDVVRDTLDPDGRSEQYADAYVAGIDSVLTR